MNNAAMGEQVLKRPRVFVSYSHEDEPALKQLQPFLKPLEDDGLVACWDDTRLQGGDDWQAEIEAALAAATMAVLFISQHFLASNFIRQEELPRILAREQAGEVTVLPIFLSPSTVDHIEFPFVDRQGNAHKTRLTRFQGYGTPQKPLSKLSRPDREQVYVELSQRIRALGEQETPQKPAAEPEPHFDNEHQRALSEALEAAYLRKAERLSAGQDATEVQQEILNLKRRLRQGPQLKAGDFLLDGRYKLLERLGSGGFATIWKGYDQQRHELVALKVLHSQYAEDRTRRERFFRGAKQMAKLHHPGIVRVLAEELADEGYYFFVMEYLDGGDFHQAVLHNRMPVAERLAVIAAVGEALQYAHEQGVIHRDIKPANIILDHQGRPWLTDFDLVRALDTTGGTRTGMLGTWIYAAPEAMDKPQEVRSPADVYSLAMTAVFALYGKDLPNAVFRDASAFVDTLNISPALKGVLQRALAWEWPARYASVAEFCQALASPPPKYEPYRTFRDAFQDGSASPEMVYLPGGTFIQGKGLDWERPVHEMTLDAFAIGRYPVTVGEFRRFVEAKRYQTEAEREGGAYVYSGMEWGPKPDANWRNPYFPQDDCHPVVCLSWNDAIAYCEWLSEQTGERYLLPTEAQWEYACRASSEAAYCFGDDVGQLEEYAWYSKNSEGKTHPVGQKRANAWGLYDMHGNVWEWVQDWYGSYSKEPQSNPSGPETGSDRLVRGGSWLGDAGHCRSACRDYWHPGGRDGNLGFRLARQV